MNSYEELLNITCGKSNKVTVSSICPRLACSEPDRDKIERVNAGLLDMCSDKANVEFIDSTPSFSLCDGSLNDGYFIQDGVHLTRSATNKLAKNLRLRVRDAAEGACRDKHSATRKPRTETQTPQSTRKQQNHNVRQAEPASTHYDQNEDSGWQTQRRKGRRYSHHEQRHTDDWRCLYCAETGHLKDTCRHQKPVECNKCHYSGHKAKFCDILSY